MDLFSLCGPLASMLHRECEEQLGIHLKQHAEDAVEFVSETAP
jgi:hypothetical protein